MFRLCLLLAACVSIDVVLFPALASAQSDLSSCKIYSGDAGSHVEQLEDVKRFYGTADQPARILCDELQFFADYAELFSKQDRVTARGHIVFVTQGNQIWADRMEFNTKTRTGTFYNARGSTMLSNGTDRSLFGSQEPEAAFWGEKLEKLGPKKYRITHGGFTTCVQPTPRWEIVSGTVTLNLDEYALLTNALFRVKGVPLMYLPAFYYPIQEDDRATGFLIPTYGASTVKGQVLSNAFFWAIGRSHDATLYHDWMSKAGQQLGGEYRYIAGPGSQGNSRFTWLDEKPVTDAAGNLTNGTKSYSIGGDFGQRLPGTFSVRGSADYFSSVITQQTYQQDITRATNRTRRFGAFTTGTLAGLQVSANAERNDFFNTPTSLTTYGSMPRVNISRPERPIAGSPVYFGVGGEYVTILRSSVTNDVKTSDQGLTRFDVAPTVRVPFNRWPFLGFNTSFGWHGTYWTESLEDTATPPQAQINEGLARQYVDFTVRATGPVFNRIFNPPEGKEGLKYKHVIQPSFTMQYISPTQAVFDRIVRLESIDSVVGGTRYTYDLTNRLYAKKEVAREVMSVSLSQTYYTNEIASKYDPRYQSSFTVESQQKNSNFSPVAFQVRAAPTDRIQGDFRTEWDPKASAITTISANGSFSDGDWLNGSAGWSQRRYIADFPGFNDPDRADQYINGVVNIRRFHNHIGGTYAFNYDILRDRFLNQRYVAYYNAQCCGIGVEYQTFNLQGSLVRSAVPQDRRFNISFTLAGIGTFSNLFGAFGGQQSR